MCKNTAPADPLCHPLSLKVFLNPSKSPLSPSNKGDQAAIFLSPLSYFPSLISRPHTDARLSEDRASRRRATLPPGELPRRTESCAAQPQAGRHHMPHATPGKLCAQQEEKRATGEEIRIYLFH